MLKYYWKFNIRLFYKNCQWHFYCFYDFCLPTGIMTFSDNNFSNITAGSGLSSFYDVFKYNSRTNQNVYNNTFSNITSGSGTSYGISLASANTRSVYGNTIGDFSGAGTVMVFTFPREVIQRMIFTKIKFTIYLAVLLQPLLVQLQVFIFHSQEAWLLPGNNVYNNIIGNLAPASAATGSCCQKVFGSQIKVNIKCYHKCILQYNLFGGAGGTNFGLLGFIIQLVQLLLLVI